MQLIVLGMHRSGTSVLARLLNLMGVYFGPEGISTGANKENPKGFWERRDVRVLNDFVLHSVGCDWNRVSSFDVDRIPAEVTDEFLIRAAKIVLEMDANRPWFLKEPRLCLLLPLWLRVLESPICIHIYRPPVEVAASLRTRNQIPIEVGLALWQKYMVLARRASNEIPGAIVSHRDLMTNPMEVVSRLKATLESHGVRGLCAPLASEVSTFVSDGLYRERELRADLLPFSQAPQNELYRKLLAGKPLPARFRSLGQKDNARLADYESGLPPVVSPAEKRKAELLQNEKAKEQEQERNRNLAALLPTMKGLEVGLGLQRDLVASLKDGIEAARSKTGAVEESLGEYRRENLEQARSLGELTRENADLLRTALLSAVKGLETEFGVQRDVVTSLKDGIEAARAKTGAVEESLGEYRRENMEQARSLGELKGTVVTGLLSVQENFGEYRRETLEQTRTIDELARENVQILKTTLLPMVKDFGAALEAQRDLVTSFKGDLTSENATLKITLAARVREATEQSRELVSLRGKLKELADSKALVEESVRVRFNEIVRLTQLLGEAESELEVARVGHSHALRNMEAQLEQARAEREKSAAEMSRARAEREKTVAEMSQALQQTSGDLAASCARLSEQEQAGLVLQMRMNVLGEVLEFERGKTRAMMKSSSWRMTAPLRRMTTLFTRNNGGNESLTLEEARVVIRASGLFDDAWYLRMNQDVLASGIDPVVHYLIHGAAEGREPNENFETKSYLSTYPGLSESGMNPLLHYIETGAVEAVQQTSRQGNSG